VSLTDRDSWMPDACNSVRHPRLCQVWEADVLPLNYIHKMATYRDHEASSVFHIVSRDLRRLGHFNISSEIEIPSLHYRSFEFASVCCGVSKTACLVTGGNYYDLRGSEDQTP
jgi:hypothetical protein